MRFFISKVAIFQIKSRIFEILVPWSFSFTSPTPVGNVEKRQTSDKVFTFLYLYSYMYVKCMDICLDTLVVFSVGR